MPAEIPVARRQNTHIFLLQLVGYLDSAGKVYDYIYRVCFEDSFPKGGCCQLLSGYSRGYESSSLG